MKHKIGSVMVVVLFGGTASCTAIVNPETENFATETYGANCTVDSECISGVCEQQPGATVSRCTEMCSQTSACPSGAGDPASICGENNMCQFLGTATFGSPCERNTDCGSGLCETQGQFNMNRCTATCSETSACPSSGIASICGDENFCEIVSPPPLELVPNVGYLYVGPIGDHGWTLTHEESRLALLEAYPNAMAEAVNSVAPQEAPARIDEFVSNGSNVVVGTSFDFLDAVRTKATEYPDVNFLICSGFRTDANLGSYFGRMYQVIYIMGYLAGRMSLLPGHNGKVGLVGPVVIPETVRHVNAFALGARRANPDIEIYLEWVEAWFNPPVETAKTQLLLDEADVELVMGFTDTVIPVEVAGSATTTSGRPVMVIGYDNADTCDVFKQDRCLTSAYWNWSPLVNPIVQQMIDGTWDPRTPVWQQMRASRDMSSAHFSELDTSLVPTDIRVEVEELIPELTADTEEARMRPFDPPQGGIRDISGSVRLNPGESFTDADLLNMCWLVEGIRHADGSPATVPSSCVGER